MAKKNVSKSVIRSQFSIDFEHHFEKRGEVLKVLKAEKEELVLSGTDKTAKRVEGGYFDKLDKPFTSSFARNVGRDVH